jgi:D-alanine-D-alanine ligase
VGKALQTLGHRPFLVAVTEDAQLVLRELKLARPKAVINLAGGLLGDGRRHLHAAALLDFTGLPYTGAVPHGLALAQDKARTKDILLRHGLPTPRYHLVKVNDQFPKLRELVWPLIVKPRFGHGCRGIHVDSVVVNERELQKAVKAVHARFNLGALIEEYVEGREIHATLLGNLEHQFLPAVEVRFAPELPRPILTEAITQTKRHAGVELVAPALLHKREEFLLRDLVLRTSRLLECRDYLRVDIRLRDGLPCIVDVNANPSLAAGGSVMRAAQAARLPLTRIVENLLRCALERAPAAPSVAPT